MNQFCKFVTTSSVRLLTGSFKNTRNLTSLSNDTVQQNLVDTDLLTSNLKNAQSVTGILEIVKTNYNIMNASHTIQALKAIFALQKHGRSGMPTSQILKHPDFERICDQLKYNAGVIDLKETVDALKVMTFVGVSSDSTIYQILLQLLRHNVNQMSLSQIMFTEFLLSKAKPSPLVDALQIALPIVYEIQLATKLNTNNLSQLKEHMYYVTRKNFSNESVALIVNSLMKVKYIDGKTSLSIIWSICDVPANEFFEPLLSKTIKAALNDQSMLSYQDLETTISKLLSKYSAKMPFYYNEQLFDYCAEILIRDDLGFEYAVHLLKKYLRLNHQNFHLLNYISEKCHINTDLIENGDPLHTYNIICGCALSEFRPKYFETIKESFLKIKNYTNFIHRDIFLIKLQTALTVLGIYIPELLKESLLEHNLASMFKRNYMLDFENVLLINQAVRLYKPELSTLLPTQSVMERVKAKIRPVKFYPLEGSLHHVFGGENFVKTPARTKLSHHIDHLVVIKQDGQPIALNPADVYVEDINCDSPSQIVLIMVLKKFHYTINNRQLLGNTSFMLQTLENKGYTVVPISLEVWQSLQDFEKLPYIEEAIKSKFEHLDQMHEVS